MLELVSSNRSKTCTVKMEVYSKKGKKDLELDIDTRSSLDWKESGDGI